MEHITRNYEVAPLLEKVLEHRLYLLRLYVDRFDLSQYIPFTLLRLDQEDRCVAFITNCTRSDNNDEELESPSEQPPYEPLKVDDCLNTFADRYADIFDTVPEARPNFVRTSFLIALCIVKLRIIARYEAKCERMDSFLHTSIGQRLEDCVQHIAHYVVGDKREAARVAEQERHVERYLEIIKSPDSTYLELIINPELLKSCKVMSNRLRANTLNETIWNSNQMLTRIPGAIERLKKALLPPYS
ncbi:hypothetical protein FGB62_45g131 [Gracilaria domingensis]|nr:hypothetical protein FGB62_45g131 [Gracilaria domingensis]